MTLFFVAFAQAKAEYEREERKREKRKATGEDTWMLPSVNDRIADEHENIKVWLFQN